MQIGNRCGLWVLSSKAIKTSGSEQKIRVGRVPGNRHIFFGPNLVYSCGAITCIFISDP